MKFHFKKTLIVLGVVLGLGAVQQVSAHEQIGSLTVSGGPAATGAGATDLYVVTCFSDPLTGGNAAADQLFFQIRDATAGGNLVGMTVLKPGAAANGMAVSTVDPVGGSDPTYSQIQQINGGNGDYLVTVWHTGAAASESYTFTYHCQTNGGVHTGTKILRVSNQ